MNILTLKARWNTPNQATLDNLGISSNNDEWVYKTVHVNVNNIAYMSEYEGYVAMCFSANYEDVLITNIKYTQANLEKIFNS